MSYAGYSRVMEGWLAGCWAATTVICAYPTIYSIFSAFTSHNGDFFGVVVGTFLFSMMFMIPFSVLVFIVTGALTVIPAAVVVWISEMFRIRSILFFGCAGAVMGGLTLYLLQVGFARPTLPTAQPPGLNPLYVWAGLAAGLAYWYVAGKRAGQDRSGDPS